MGTTRRRLLGSALAATGMGVLPATMPRMAADRLRRIGYEVDVSAFDAPFFVARTAEIRIWRRLLG
ncbi:MAG TPA: hypothetical protein VMR74_07625 [Gammaproteobacteria bacterium]|nr:hypothetical protein [Gammaproteobacteria bacterium]